MSAKTPLEFNVVSVARELRALASPAAERLSDTARLDAFVKAGGAAADLLIQFAALVPQMSTALHAVSVEARTLLAYNEALIADANKAAAEARAARAA